MTLQPNTLQHWFTLVLGNRELKQCVLCHERRLWVSVWFKKNSRHHTLCAEGLGHEDLCCDRVVKLGVPCCRWSLCKGWLPWSWLQGPILLTAALVLSKGFDLGMPSWLGLWIRRRREVSWLGFFALMGFFSSSWTSEMSRGKSWCLLEGEDETPEVRWV